MLYIIIFMKDCKIKDLEKLKSMGLAAGNIKNLPNVNNNFSYNKTHKYHLG